MEVIGVWVIIGLVTLAHLFMAYFVSIELADYPLINKFNKLIWYVIIWLLPVVGTLLAYRKLRIKFNARVSTGSASQAEWYAGHKNDSHDGSNE